MTKKDIALLADAYARAKAQLSALTTVVEGLRADILKTKRSLLVGDEFKVKVTESSRDILVKALVMQTLTPAQVKKCTASVPVTTVTCEPIVVVKKGRAA